MAVTIKAKLIVTVEDENGVTLEKNLAPQVAFVEAEGIRAIHSGGLKELGKEMARECAAMMQARIDSEWYV